MPPPGFRPSMANADGFQQPRFTPMISNYDNNNSNKRRYSTNDSGGNYHNNYDNNNRRSFNGGEKRSRNWQNDNNYKNF